MTSVDDPAGAGRRAALVTEAMVESAARIIAARMMGLVRDPDGSKLPDDLWGQMVPHARAALLAAAPLIVERCAQTAEAFDGMPVRWVGGLVGHEQIFNEGQIDATSAAARNIRSLK